jgi:hypothetical protein
MFNIKMNNYIIAIPSYKRNDTLKKKTMKVLNEYRINPQKIYIFVADNNEKKLYENTLEPKSYNKIVVGKPGIQHIRNFMPKYFPEKKPIVYMDDDISKISICNNNNINNDGSYDKKNNKLEKLSNLDGFIKNAFKYSKNQKMDNWGVYPTDNPYFMKPSLKNNNHVSKDLKFLIGFLTGVINNRKAEIRSIGDKEDYERTIKYYLKDNGVLRYNNVSCNTNCYKEPGGIQATRKKEDSARNANYLVKTYPDLVKINNNRNSGFVEIRLRDSSLSKKNENNKSKKKNKFIKSIRLKSKRL